MQQLDEEMISVPPARAARIARLSNRQITYWAHNGIVSPSVEQSVTGHQVTRLYNFTDLMSLLVAAELRRRQNISLQNIRRVVTHLRARGYDRPLAELRYATIGSEIYFQHPDGSWEGGLLPDQVVIHEVLDLKPLRARIADGLKRSTEDAGRLEKRRGTLGSKQVFAGTRIPVETVRQYLREGRTADQIVASFPALTTADVEAVDIDTVA